MTSLDQLLSDEIHTLGTRRQQSIYKATEAQSRILQVLVVNTCIGAFLCVIGLWFVRRWVIQPVGVLKQAIARVRQGDFSPQVSLPRNDELGKLGSQISQMAAQIGRLQDRLVDRERQAAASEMVAHLEEHMRAPLSEIRALSATGAENEVRDREVLECQERIAATVTQFEAWLRDLKGSLAPAKSEPRPVLVSEVVSNVLTAVRPTLERRRVQAVAGIDPRVGEVRIDRLQFEQAIVALVTNAAEASKGGQTVRIVVRPCQISDDSWELEVQDEGSGIPPELMEKIFLPFFTTKRDGNGIGLGLVKAIIGQHGGELHVHSERGKGSRFTVRLPQLTRLVGARA
ncbi:MAG: HAMP domain-containing histidine kinase [Phycisphaerae bacterium]|nr:HAMP domain-containing histidine kinase [Phycisphaerae bacterium]